jgi:hypothetical protein
VTSPFRDLGFVAGRETRPRWGRGLLSAIVPGLGQLVGGRIRTGLMFLAPVVVLDAPGRRGRRHAAAGGYEHRVGRRAGAGSELPGEVGERAGDAQAGGRSARRQLGRRPGGAGATSAHGTPTLSSGQRIPGGAIGGAGAARLVGSPDAGAPEVGGLEAAG